MLMTVLSVGGVDLVPLEHGHVDKLVSATRAHGSDYEWTTVPLDHPGMASWVHRALACAETGTEIPFVVVLSDSGRVVGSTSYLNVDRWGGETTDLPRSVEVGRTWYARDVWGTRVNPACKLALLAHAFEVWHVERLWLKTDARNERSRVAIERLGASFEGVLRRNQPGGGTRGDATVRDTAVYSVIPKEWPHVKASLEQRIAMTPD